MKPFLFNEKHVVVLIYILLFAHLAFLVTDGFFDLKRNQNLYVSSVMDSVYQGINPLFSEINNFPKTTANDVLFLSQLSSLNQILNSASNDKAINDLEIDFLGFLKEHPAYYKLRYLDEQANEIVKVEFDGKTSKVISQEGLENKKDRDFFQRTTDLNEREIFISPLGTDIDSSTSVARYATPVFNYDGEPKGIIILDVYADYFLNNVRRAQREGETVFLISEKGYYLAHPDKKKEFAFMTNGDNNDNIYNDYPEASEKILSSKFSKGKFETDEQIFSYRQIYPTLASFELHRGSEKIFGGKPEENYFWVLVNVSEKDEINKALMNLKKDYLRFLSFSGIIILIIVALVFVLAFKYRSVKTTVKRKKT